MFATFGVGEVLLSLLWFFLIFIWIMLLLQVFMDIFRSHDMSGGMKALWIIALILLPYLGVFIYLIVRGPKMAEHNMARAKAQDEAARTYIQSVAGPASAADELHRLAELKDRGVIDDAEFQRLKAKVIA